MNIAQTASSQNFLCFVTRISCRRKFGVTPAPIRSLFDLIFAWLLTFQSRLFFWERLTQLTKKKSALNARNAGNYAKITISRAKCDNWWTIRPERGSWLLVSITQLWFWFFRNAFSRLNAKAAAEIIENMDQWNSAAMKSVYVKLRKCFCCGERQTFANNGDKI